MTTIDRALCVATRVELATFLEQLRRELVAEPSRIENANTLQYLEALSAYLHDLPGFVKNSGWPGSSEEPTWALVAAILAAAVIYE